MVKVDYNKTSWGQRILDTSNIQFEKNQGGKKALCYIACIAIGILTLGIPHLVRYGLYGRVERQDPSNKMANQVNNFAKNKLQTSSPSIKENSDIYNWGFLLANANYGTCTLYWQKLKETYKSLEQEQKDVLLKFISSNETKNKFIELLDSENKSVPILFEDDFNLVVKPCCKEIFKRNLI